MVDLENIVIETLIFLIIKIGFGFITGFLFGYLFKKVSKFVLFIIGIIVGLVFVLGNN